MLDYSPPHEHALGTTEMAPEATATQAAPRGGGRPRQVLRHLTAHRSQVLVATLALLVALGPLTDVGRLRAQHGLAGLWIYPMTTLPEAWAIAVMTYTLLRPALVAGNYREAGVAADREVVTARWLRWSTLAALIVAQVPALYYDHWLDVLFLSGWLVLLIGLELAGRAPAKLRLTLRRLAARQILSPPERVEEMVRGLDRTGKLAAAVSACLVAVVLLITSPAVLLAASHAKSWRLGPTASFLALLIVAGAVAGGWLGRMIAYAWLLGRALRKKELHLRLIPGHPDGAAGLKAVGDFHLFQSLVVSLPAIFLGTWLLLLSLLGASRLLSGYHAYLDQYLWLLPAAMVFEIVAFVLPMISVHLTMKSRKEADLLPEADKISADIVATRFSLGDHATREREAANQEHLAWLTARYQDMEDVPTWPVDSSIRRRFTLRNLGLLIPFLAYIVGHAPFWQQVSDVLKG
jgi:hypothetical protein